MRTRHTLIDLPCPCGGILRPGRFRTYDASWLLGIPAILRGDLPGSRCSRCGSRTIPGFLIEAAANRAALMTLGLGRRLSGVEARFLRKSALFIGEGELARRLDLKVRTVRAWEASSSLTADQDFTLRSLVVGCLLEKATAGRRFKPAEVLRVAVESLQSARRKRAPRNPLPLRIPTRLAARSA